MRLYSGVHCVQDISSGFAITLATEISMKGNWVMGHENVATHCFIIYEESITGKMWRLDGQPSNARWKPISKFPDDIPVAIWCVADDTSSSVDVSKNVNQMVNMGRYLDDIKYDWKEIRNQGIVAASYAFAFLPFMTKLRLVGSYAGMDNSMICTRVAQITMLAGLKGKYYDLLNTMPDLFPERFAQLMRSGETEWTRRVR